MKRLDSIQLLRGYAAFFVALGHLYYAFFSAPDMILAVGPDAAKSLLDVNNNMPAFWRVVPRSSIWVDLFFLISGFVIEISIAKNSSFAFLIQRAFRIYIVFWVACVLHIIANIYIFGIEFKSSWWKNILLINDYSLSPVSWTLICELHFYLLIAVLLFFKINTFLRIAIINLLFLLYYCLLKTGFLNASVGALIGEFFYFCWMSLGAAIYMVYKKTEGECKEKNFILLLATAVVVYFEYQLALNNTFGFPVFSDSDTISLASALAIFVTFIFVNPYYTDKLSNFLGNISYPLYCLHFPVGWVIHYFLISKMNFNPLMSLIFVMLIVIFLSYIVHLYVEKPANILGKKISEKLNKVRLD